MIVNTTFRTISAIYDFSVDGGAVSTIQLKASFKPNSCIYGYITKGIIAPTSGGAATIAFGVSSVGTGTIVASGAYNGGSYAVGYVASGTAVQGAYVVPATGGILTMTIGTAALTAGKIVIACLVVEMQV